MSSTNKPLVAFFGATGGSTLNAITHALQNGCECTALARTPSKLTNMLLEKKVPQTTLDSHLHIIKGDVRDVTTVKETLALGSRTADIILTGVGATTLTELSHHLDLCSTTATNILAALKELNTATKPLLIALSTTGLSETEEPRDLPLLMKPLYSWLLGNPHKDKLQMEHIIEQQLAAPENERVIRGYVLPRPSLLTNGAALGGEKVRVGLENAPAVGYTISRDEVGLWMYENLIESTNREKYVNHKPTITH